jgi:hypothetical protein
MVDQTGPLGSTTYDQTGSTSYTDPATGKTYNIPKFGATNTLSGPAQGIVDNSLGALASPFSLDNDAVEGRLMELGRKRLDPMLAQRRASLEQQLADRGIRMGSEAYDRAMGSSMQGENDAFNQLLLTGRGQAVNEAMTARNQPMNEMNMILGRGQPNLPTPSAGVANTDYAGLVNNNYSQQMQQHQLKSQEQQALMGGLFGLGSSLIMSDRRSKTDIKRVGETDDGQTVYSYRYKAGGPPQIGLMAQEVAEKHPDAVATLPGGMMAVNYAKALEGI